jgi:hypothetical protein
VQVAAGGGVVGQDPVAKGGQAVAKAAARLVRRGSAVTKEEVGRGAVDIEAADVQQVLCAGVVGEPPLEVDAHPSQLEQRAATGQQLDRRVEVVDRQQ